MPRLYREAPLMGIWEGSGNVSALDTLRAMATRPECVDVLFDELADPAGQDAAAGRARRPTLRPNSATSTTMQYRARKVAEDISLALQGALLVRHGHPAVAEAFLATRLDGGGAAPTAPCRRPRPRAHPRAGAGQGLTSRDDARDPPRRLRQPEDDDLRGHRPGCPNHLQPSRKRQRDRRRHPAGVVRTGRERRPRPERACHPGVRPRAGLLRRLRPVGLRRPHLVGGRQVATRAPSWTERRRRSTTCPTGRGIR